MLKGFVESIDWSFVGAQLAQGDDGDQVKFFKAFVSECRSWGTRWQVEQQLASVNIKLTKNECETLKMLGFTGEE